MSSYKKYPKYIDSNIEWLGEVPEHFELLRINDFTRVVSDKNYPNEELLSVYRDYGVIIKSSRSDNHNKAGENLSNYKLVKHGYLVLNKMKTWQGSLGVSEYRGIVSPAYITCKVDDKRFNRKYLHHVLRCKNYIYEYNRLSYGVRTDQWDMRYDDFKNIKVLCPPLEEQTAIANFLDEKTSLIDESIKNKQALIALLKEQIIKLTLHGYNEETNTNSWESFISSNSKLIKAKRIFEEINEKNYPNQNLLAVTQDRGVLPKSMCSENFVSPSEESLKTQKLVIKDSFVISLRSFQGGIEFSKYEGIVSPAYNVFKLKEQYNSDSYRSYYKYLFKSSPFIELLNTLISGIRDGQNISYKDFSNLTIPIPSNRVLKKVTELDETLMNLNQRFKDEIKLLQEYKQSLISEAVTGKIDVRAEVAVEGKLSSPKIL